MSREAIPRLPQAGRMLCGITILAGRMIAFRLFQECPTAQNTAVLSLRNLSDNLRAIHSSKTRSKRILARLGGIPTN